MKVEKHDGQPERSILTALIVSTPVLAKIAPKLSKSLFRSEWSDLIANWCAEHYKKYGTAPGAMIEQVYAKWCAESQNEDVKKTINRLLSSLSQQYEYLAEGIDVAFMTDTATGYFNQVMVEKHIDNLRQHMERGHFEKAVQDSETFKRLELSRPAFIDLLTDKAAQREALEAKQNVLIKYTSGLGKFWGDELSEESLVAIVAPMKVGKSYYMLDLGWKGLMQGRRVAYFQIGDLSKNQIIRRFHARAAYRPLQRRAVNFPIGIIPSQHGLTQVDFDMRVFDNDLSWEVGEKAFEKAASKYGSDMFRLSCHPTRSVSIADIEGILDGWNEDGWHAQIVVLDYSENLAPVNPKSMPLDQVEETWAIMSRLREKKRCCFITALQTNKEGFNTWVLTRKNFSKNKMIFAHATSIIGLNQTDEEKGRQVMRLNFVVRREDKFQETECCYVAECRDLCHVSVVSHF